MVKRGNPKNSKPKIIRPGWHESFMAEAYLAARRSSCLRRGVGAVIVRDKRILATGYNGAPPGVKTCLERGYCYRSTNQVKAGGNKELCYALHAEENAILQLQRNPEVLRTSESKLILYVTTIPCTRCTRQIAGIDIQEIWFLNGDYNEVDDIARDIIQQKGISLNQFDIDSCQDEVTRRLLEEYGDGRIAGRGKTH